MSLWRGGKNRKSFKKSDISKPTEFEHRIHADFDPITGDIRGLPLVNFFFFNLNNFILIKAMASFYSYKFYT